MSESLRFNERTKEFVLVSNDQERAEEAGLTLSTSTKGPDGELVWFTDVDYAALGFWDMADARAKTALSSLKRDFEASRARESNFDPPVPRGFELFQYQRAGIQYAASRPHSLIGDSMGLGKAQPLDALIATPAGWRTMGSIQVGDFVLNSEGNPVRVTGVYPQGIKRCFRITFRDGTSTRCCDEHLWAVKDGNRRARGRDWAVKSLREISDRGLQTPGGGNKWSTPLAGPLSFSGEWKSVIPPYLMGVLLGDGYTKTKKPCFSTPDQDYWIVSRVQSELPPDTWVTENRHPACPQYYLCGGNRAHKANPFAGALAKDGLNVASSDKFIPAWALVSGTQCRWDLLNGLMDTDGSCIKNRTTFHTISPRLAEDVAALVRSLGGVAIVRWYDRAQEDKGWEAQVNVKLLGNPFSLPRKAQSWSPAKRNKPSKFIESITEMEPVSQQCISVDSDDGLYVTDQGIVTHNTAQAIVLGNYFGYEKVLIVCPGSIRLNWRREVMRWSTLRRKTTYPILRSADGVNPYANFVIVSYDLLRNPGIHAALMRMRWDMVILDEAHYLKSMSAKRAQAVFGGGLGQFKMNGIVQNAERVTALTGTPLPNRPRECYTLARALNWESIDWASYDSFCYRFNPSAQMKTKHVLEMKGRLPELQARLRCNFMVRRLKEDVLKELPDKRYELAYLEKTGPIKKVLQKEKLIDFTMEDLENPFSEIWGQVSTVRREMGEAKAPQVVHHVKHLLDTVEVPKLVMFSYHKSVMDYLKKELSRYGVVEVRGGISTERKQQAVDAFVNDPDCRIFSGQLIAAGTGIDGLQKVCELALITEPDWVPGNNDQAIDRLHRIGQHGNVIAQFAVVEGSLDERVLSSMFGKTQTIHASLDGGY